MTPPLIAGAGADERLEREDLAVYAPTYKVMIDGRELSPETKGDVIDINVVLEKDKPSGFSLNLNDWDDEKLETKYSSRALFGLGANLTVDLGYADRLVRVLLAEITSLSVRFPDGGASTLTVGGQDKLWEIAKRKPTANDRKQWVNVADWQVVQEIAGQLHLDVELDKRGPTQHLIVIKNQDYHSFLVERAARIDFEVYITPNPDPAANRPLLHFVKRQDCSTMPRPSTFQFEWGRNLMSLSLRQTTAHQVRSVTVRAWDPQTKKAIVVTATESDLPASSSGPDSGAAKATPGSQDLIVDRTFKSSEEARRFAVAELMRRTNAFVTGTAKVPGLPDLRPGALADLSGVGDRFSGCYQVTKVTHQLGAGGFTTELEIERGREGTTLGAPNAQPGGHR